MRTLNIGLIGLGTMGSALALNIAENGFGLVVTTRSPERVGEFLREAGSLSEKITGAVSPEDLVEKLPAPRSVILMVPAGAATDAVIAEYAPLLSVGDTIIDAGNADFHDTRRRTKALAAQGLNFTGMGVSGGEDGARHGPSVMVGGSQEIYAHFAPVIHAISAKYQGISCADWLGPDGAGHFVKTVHNGIEYADMQLIAEVYGLLRAQKNQSPDTISRLFERWNRGPLSSYLMEISAKVLGTKDPVTGQAMVDVIQDKAGQKGTGRWAVIEALSLGQSASAIEAAVGARSWSSDKNARLTGAALFATDPHVAGADNQAPITENALESALLSARILAYAQGFQILLAASETYQWNLDLARIAEIWRAGCIIRSTLLDDIAEAFRDELPGRRLLFAPVFTKPLKDGTDAMRQLVSVATRKGLPVPGFAAALSWFDSMRQGRGTTNLIQAQRDFFGAHGFERTDAAGPHHGPWDAAQG